MIELKLMRDGFYFLPVLAWRRFECDEPRCGRWHQAFMAGWFVFHLEVTW